MIAKQKQTLESFVRVRAFLEAHPIPGPLSYPGARETLDDVVRRLREHAGAQVTGRELSRAELRVQRELIRQMLNRHVRPIVAIARAQATSEPAERLPATIRMPRASDGVTKTLQACDGIIEAVRPFEAAFVANGMPADFLAQLASARDVVERTLSDRATFTGQHIAARAGLTAQLRRGRRAVHRLDAVVRAAFDGDAVVLETWRVAKRVHLLPGGSAERTIDAAPLQLVA